VHVREPGRRSSHSQSLERGLAILAAFRPGRPLLGVSDVARQIGLRRSTAHRYLSTLAELGYLEQDPETRKYRLGTRVIDLGLSALNSMELRELSAPHLQRLSDETGCTANLAILDGTDVILIDRVRSSTRHQHQLELNLHIGSRLPSYCTSTGKVLLAYLPPEQLRETLARIVFERRGPNTLMSAPQLQAELERVRRDGLAVGNEELAYGLCSIAAPVRAHTGEVAAAINLALARPPEAIREVIARLGPPLRRASADISRRAGYRP
jgi:IclR family pca regulon transcriptional regulator